MIEQALRCLLGTILAVFVATSAARETLLVPIGRRASSVQNT